MLSQYEAKADKRPKPLHPTLTEGENLRNSTLVAHKGTEKEQDPSPE